MKRFILGLGIFLLIATAVSATTYYVISYRPTINEIHVQGPGLGWNNDYAWFDESGDYVEVKDKPQVYGTYPYKK